MMAVFGDDNGSCGVYVCSDHFWSRKSYGERVKIEYLIQRGQERMRLESDGIDIIFRHDSLYISGSIEQSREYPFTLFDWDWVRLDESVWTLIA